MTPDPQQPTAPKRSSSRVDSIDPAAFGEGSHARIMGLPQTMLPGWYSERKKASWLTGWRDADKNWGRSAGKNRTALPPVVGTAAWREMG